jgi:hypothetical protein
MNMNPNGKSRLKMKQAMRTKHILPLALLAALVIPPLPGGVARAATRDKSPPTELFSPGKKYSVAITRHAVPGADPAQGPFTLTLLANGKAISHFPTEAVQHHVGCMPATTHSALSLLNDEDQCVNFVGTAANGGIANVVVHLRIGRIVDLDLLFHHIRLFLFLKHLLKLIHIDIIEQQTVPNQPHTDLFKHLLGDGASVQ